MKVDKEAINVLTEDIEEELLEQMPEWFNTLREGYKKRVGKL